MQQRSSRSLKRGRQIRSDVTPDFVKWALGMLSSDDTMERNAARAGSMDSRPVTVSLDNSTVWKVEFIGESGDLVFFTVFADLSKRSGVWNTVLEEGHYDNGEPLSPRDSAVIRLAHIGLLDRR
jgi:hypothetical protein